MTLPLSLIDAHCHLQDERIPPGDVPNVLKSAAAAGIQNFIVNGCWPGDWQRVLDLHKQYPDIIPQLGLHPWWIDRKGDGTSWLETLRKLLQENPHAGLGECGLDKGPKAPSDTFTDQIEAFEAQLQLAQELQRPVSIHCVKAYSQIHSSLVNLKLSIPVVLHAWTGSADMTAALIKALPNVYFSLNGYLTKLAPEKVIPMVQSIPLDRLLIESDCPDGVLLLPENWLQALPQLEKLNHEQGQQQRQQQQPLVYNTPLAVRRNLTLIAAIRGVEEDEIAKATRETASKIFCQL